MNTAVCVSFGDTSPELEAVPSGGPCQTRVPSSRGVSEEQRDMEPVGRGRL